MAVDIPVSHGMDGSPPTTTPPDLLAADLAALPQDAGPIPLTDALETDFHLFARQYQLSPPRLPGRPLCPLGGGPELDLVRTPAIPAPHGDALSADYVDQAVAPLVRDAVPHPRCRRGLFPFRRAVPTRPHPRARPSAFLLRSLERREDGSLQAVLDRFTEDGRYQTGSLTLPPSTWPMDRSSLMKCGMRHWSEGISSFGSLIFEGRTAPIFSHFARTHPQNGPFTPSFCENQWRKNRPSPSLILREIYYI